MPLGRGRQELDHQAAGAIGLPAFLELLRHREAHLRRDLLGLPEILVRGFLETLALQGHDALIAAAVGALVDGHGEIAGPQQLAGSRRGLPERLEPVLVEPGGGAQAIRRVEVDDDHVDDAVGLGLQLEAPLELEGRAEHHGQRGRLADDARDPIGIAVAGDDGVDGGPETHDAPAHVERLDRERQDDVVVSFERGRAHAFAAPRHHARMPFCA